MLATDPLERPLDGIRSIKAKLALLVGTSIVVAAVVVQIGAAASVPIWLTVPVTVSAALGVTQWLARGLTSPLREMTDATSRMATGDYSRRVTATSADEVGQLGVAFNTMAADLADADRQRRQLVATVSHELRTPLAAQQALLENLVDGVVTPDDAVLRAALGQAERLGSLVGDLLDLSRLDGGQTRLDLAPVSVLGLVERAVAEAVLASRAMTHVVSVTPLDLHVVADAARLEQVLANLLDNAARHCPPGSTVHVTAAEEGPDRWTLEVTDDGPGIPRRHAERIFHRFGSGDDAAGGTGIGLAIASWVCELHGGSISAEPPRPGETGARLRAVLPRDPNSDDRPTDRPTDRQNHQRTDAQPRRQTLENRVPTAPVTPISPPAQPVAAPRPFLDAIFGDLWPEAGLTTKTRVVTSCLGVGVLAAVILPGRDIGLALFAVLLTGGAVVLRSSVRRRSLWTGVSAVLCVALASLTVVRAAQWVSVLAIAAGIVLTTTALTGARSGVGLVSGLAAWPLSAVRGLPLLGRTLSATSRMTVLWPVLRTVAVSLVALVVFGGLFASGDAIFGSWAQSLVPAVDAAGFVFRAFVGFVIGGSLLAVCYLAINPPKVEQLTLPAGRPVVRVWEWLVPMALVVAVFVGFVVAQAAALFGGHDFVRRSTGLSYAQYVHQGFGQLTFATVLTLAAVAVAVRKAPQQTAPDRMLLRCAIGVLGVLTLVVVASALHRMDLYQQAYGFTVLRLVVDAFELWLGLLVVLVLVAAVRLSWSWLPRAVLLAGAGFVLVGGLVSPEAWVAQHNIERYQASGQLDTGYLQSLSADATPAIVAGLPADLARCVLDRPSPQPGDDWLGFNLGRARGLSAAGSIPGTTPEPTSCATVLNGIPSGAAVR
ncbi:MAG: DUF4173 domain-containing protein [Humibacillus sp.]|nr:DUF4173 domain-containing protein [Humibacillus sp.]MDN5775565.1 DUF4173 domain-containing protein [Humibacillus sp.]